MRLPKWLLLQMLQTRITCSKKKVKTFFFYYNITLKWSQKYQNVAQMLPKSWSIEKEKSPKSLSNSSLGDFSSGATGIRTRDTRIFSPLLYQLSYGTIIMLCLTFLKRVQRYTLFSYLQIFSQKLFHFFTI